MVLCTQQPTDQMTVIFEIYEKIGFYTSMQDGYVYIFCIYYPAFSTRHDIAKKGMHVQLRRLQQYYGEI